MIETEIGAVKLSRAISATVGGENIINTKCTKRISSQFLFSRSRYCRSPGDLRD